MAKQFYSQRYDNGGAMVGHPLQWFWMLLPALMYTSLAFTPYFQYTSLVFAKQANRSCATKRIHTHGRGNSIPLAQNLFPLPKSGDRDGDFMPLVGRASAQDDTKFLEISYEILRVLHFSSFFQVFWA